MGKKRNLETIKKNSKTKKKKGVSQKTLEKQAKKLYKINLNDNSIKEYHSTGQASKYTGVNQSTISRWCKKDVIKNNCKWSYVKPE